MLGIEEIRQRLRGDSKSISNFTRKIWRSKRDIGPNDRQQQLLIRTIVETAPYHQLDINDILRYEDLHSKRPMPARTAWKNLAHADEVNGLVERSRDVSDPLIAKFMAGGAAERFRKFATYFGFVLIPAAMRVGKPVDALNWTTSLALSASIPQYRGVKGLGSEQDDPGQRFILLGLPVASLIVYFPDDGSDAGEDVCRALDNLFATFDSMMPVSGCLMLRLAGLAVLSGRPFRHLPDALEIMRRHGERAIADAIEILVARRKELSSSQPAADAAIHGLPASQDHRSTIQAT